MKIPNPSYSPVNLTLTYIKNAWTRLTTTPKPKSFGGSSMFPPDNEFVQSARITAKEARQLQEKSLNSVRDNIV